MKGVDILTRPLEPKEIEWKVVSIRERYTVIAPYASDLTIMERLDQAFGPFGWQVTLTPTGSGIIAEISVRDPETGKWVAKQGESRPSGMMETLEEVISEARRRAAIAWGIGRELYDYPEVRITGEHRYIPKAVLKRLEGLPKAIREGKPLPKVITLNPDGSTAQEERV